ncbi:MAG: cation transporter [Candidatus Bathyarchaeota archaeon]|nr:cation transporter [Candidatus Bathyarchaeota archaeon]
MIDRKALRKKALILVWVGFTWNFVEAAVALWSASVSSSVALFAFGLDSLIEIFAGAVLIWRLNLDEEQEENAESRALKLVGVTFFVLAVFVAFQSLATLTGFLVAPQESFVGIVLVVASAVLMTVLYVGKIRLAKKLGSRALRAEAVESLMCDLQDLTVLVGLGLNVLFGWWWADPVAALFLIPFLLKEGFEAFS